MFSILPILAFQAATPARASAQAPRSLGNFIVASAAGAALDSDILKGGGTDDTAVLQGILDRAAHGRPVHLIVDGAALVSGLNIYGNTTIDCTAGGGFYLKDRSSRDIIRNVHRSREAITDEHITIRGCILNGNRWHQMDRPPSKDVRDNKEADGTWVAGLQLSGVSDVNLEHLTLWNVRSFGICFNTARYIRLRDIRVDNGSPRGDPSPSEADRAKIIAQYLNTDGVHFNGPADHIIVDGLVAHTGDDALALNANDEGGPYVGQGPITDVIASNIVLDEASYGVRILSTDARVDRVIVQNITGTVKNRVALLSHFWPARTGNIGSVQFDNINVKTLPTLSPRQLLASDHLSQTQLAKVDEDDEDYPLFGLNASIENLSLRHVMIQVADDRPLIHAGPDAVIQNLSVDFSVRDPRLLAVPLVLEAGARINEMSWALDWHGNTAQTGKSPILERGGIIRKLHWLHTSSPVDKLPAEAK